jgi:hypothetical protein
LFKVLIDICFRKVFYIQFVNLGDPFPDLSCRRIKCPK